MRAKLQVIIILFILLSLYNFADAEVREISYDSGKGNFNSFNKPGGFCKTTDNNLKKLLVNTSIAFTENRGQLTNDEVRFYDQGGSIWFTDDGVWFEVRDEFSITSQQSTVYSRESRLMTDDRRLATNDCKRVILKQEFVGANLVRPGGRGRLSWNSNFFYGSDSSKWCTEVPNYQEIYYKNLYDGIDLRYYTNENGFKYDFIVHPGYLFS